MKQRKYRTVAECEQIIKDMQTLLFNIPSDDIVLQTRLEEAIERFKKSSTSPTRKDPCVEEGQIEVSDLGCYCKWLFSTQRIKRPMLELVRSPHLKGFMPKRELDAVLNPIKLTYT